VYAQGIAQFLDGWAGGLDLVCHSIVVGSLLWGVAVLRVWREPEKVETLVLQRCVAWLLAGACGVAAVQALKIVTKAAVLASTLGELPWQAYAHTVQFRAGALQFALATALAFFAWRLCHEPAKRKKWASVIGLTIPLIVSGAWSGHAVGRLERPELLMTLTTLHGLAAATWVGGVSQLLLLWRLRRRSAAIELFWPVALTRFSALGIGAVSLLLATAVGLAWEYVGSWQGLFGTGYGTLILVKAFLLAVTLGFAYLNFRAGRRWLGGHRASEVITRVPYYIEAEIFLLLSTLFVAASVSSQPPSVDIPNSAARASEVVEMFMPKRPRLASPTHEALLAGETARLAVVGRVPSEAAAEWSDYNHNISGIFLIAMGLVALLSHARGFGWAKYWPLGFVGLSALLFFRADAETWPLGPIGFWESTFGDNEVLQHRIATLLAFALGIVETRARTGQPASDWLRFAFPVLCAFGGILLVTHAHLAFEIKSDFLIQSTHVAMGLLAAMMAVGRWLELRFTSAGAIVEARFAGLVALAAMLMIGAILAFYREPLA
jgi:copper resistance protein D